MPKLVIVDGNREDSAMPSTTLERIEADLLHLPLADQLRLMEFLAVNIRQRADARNPEREAQLKEMAQDPEMQRELRAIDAEFSGTEMDGLDHR